MAVQPLTIEQIQASLRSADEETRARALAQLSVMVKRDLALHESALPLLRAALEQETSQWALTSAAHGIEHIVGKQAAQSSWARLLRHQDQSVVCAALGTLTDKRYVPEVLHALLSRKEVRVRNWAIRALGRMPDPRSFDAIARALSDPMLRLDAIEALGDLGDPRGAALLEPLLRDTSDGRAEDNHAPTRRVCDMAADAIARLRPV